MDVPSPTKAGYIFCLFVLLFYLPIFSSFSSFFGWCDRCFVFVPVHLQHSVAHLRDYDFTLEFGVGILMTSTPPPFPHSHPPFYMYICLFVYIFFSSINIEWAKQSRQITSNTDGLSFNSQKMKHWAGKQKKMTAYNSLKNVGSGDR